MSTMKKSISSPEQYKKAPVGRITQYNNTYIGIIKDNRDEHRMGRLKVWIPEFGGDPSDSASWILVRYASPFAGASPFRFTGNDNTTYEDAQSAYGMWMVPPDIDNEVLVTFIGGEPSKGVWFGCLYQSYMNHSVPGISASEVNSGEKTGEDAPLPTSEYNRKVTGDRQFKSACKESKVVNPHKAGGLTKQGTVSDNIRGLNNSSARRESTSSVFGISTPGPIDQSTQNKLPYEKYDNSDKAQPTVRKGGHSFIMDDGDGSEHIQLQTRSGARIRIDETFGIIYIINRDGTAWMEMSEEGYIDIYGAESFSVRSGLDINLRADRDINVEAGRNITMKASKEYVSKDAVVDILSTYANTQGKTIQDLFTKQQKIDYITDYKEFKKLLDRGEDVNKVFIMCLKYNGFPTQGQPNLEFSPNQTDPSHTTLQSVDLMHLLRGSRIIGEKFGSGGDIKIHANTGLSAFADTNVIITAATDNIEINTGETLNITAGVDANINAGEDIRTASGKETHITTGEDLIVQVGKNLEFTVEFLSNITLKEDVNVLLSGSILNIHAGSGHVSNIELGTVNLKTQKFTLSSSGLLDISSSNDIKISASGQVLISSGGNMHLSAPSGSWRAYGNSMRIDAATSLIGRSPNTDVDDGGPSSLSAQSPTTLPGVSVTDSLPTEVGPVAEIATPPDLWSKQEVLPTLQRVGNKEFALTYHTQPVETIVSRFMTHEPCVEHIIQTTQLPNTPIRTENVTADPDKNYKAFVDMIAWAEGTSTNSASQNGYNVMFGNKIFNDYSTHPFAKPTQKSVGFTDLKGRANKSNAAGRYQFILKTWNEIQQTLKLPDFNPDSQERGVLFLIKNRRKALDAVKEGDLKTAIWLCRNEWASFPGNNYSQGGGKTYEALKAKFIEFGGVVKQS